MKNQIFISVLLLSFFFQLGGQTAIINESDYPEKIRVACIGNSITYGYGVEDLEKDSYPVRMQAMLGKKYEVGNFGFRGATMLKKGHKPYVEKLPFTEALKFKPHIVIIHLGLNDADPRNWARYKKEFETDYQDFINVFKNLDTEPVPRIWICRMTPVFSWHRLFKTGVREDYWAIQEAIEKVSEKENVTLIDLHSPLYSRPDLFPDALHPTEEGAIIIAKTVKSYITGDFGGLSLSPLFTDHMVIQRDKPIRIFGTANAGQNISLKFAGIEKSSIAGSDGSWSVEFAPMKAGGPYELLISADSTLRIHDILIGEVWLCSGQSNMAFTLKEEVNSGTEILLATHPDIRLFNFNTVAPSGDRQFSEEQIQKIDRGEYFQGGPWKECTPETVPDFSAVSYYFGKELNQNLDVPIGLIHNAVGGSNTESWIDRKTLEFHPEFVDMLEDWLNNKQVQNWCRRRAADNLQNPDNPNQLHPYAPSYLFATGIKPLEKYPFRGVIWYQGESNAGRIEQHEKLFTTMVADWRRFFNNQNLPFFYVQLSSINRESWPKFRDSQRRLLKKVPNTGMVVTSDIGHPTDVHPKNKKDIGYRLSLWALTKVYGFNMVYSGPLYRSMDIHRKKITLTFDHADSGLSTVDNKEVRGFEIAGNEGIFVPAKAKIRDSSVQVSGRGINNPKNVRYGWKPYTDANLVNREGLPASTFTTEE